MELEVVEQSKNRLVVNMKGCNHTFANLLRKELWHNKSIDSAGYYIEHPLKNVPRMIVETKGSETPKQAMLKAAQAIKKFNETLRKDFKKEIK